MLLVYSTEPLYQVYTRCTLQRERNLSRRRLSSDMSLNDAASLEELTKGTLRNMRMLWCELPEVCTVNIFVAVVAQGDIKKASIEKEMHSTPSLSH